jgi:hypothetical protein
MSSKQREGFDSGETTVIGCQVVFYEKGDTRATPIAAVVTDIDYLNRCHLATLPKHAMQFVLRRNVNHVLTDVQDPVAAQYGLWETLSESIQRQQLKDAERIAKSRQAQAHVAEAETGEQERVQIMRLNAAGKSNKEIAKEVGGKWNAMTVSSVIKSRTTQRVTAGSTE